MGGPDDISLLRAAASNVFREGDMLTNLLARLAFPF